MPRPTFMQGISTSRQFGYLIAYLLPGFIALGGMAPLLPAVAEWLRPVPAGELGLGLGPPLYAILGALAPGQVLSCFRFRWVLLDQVHAWTGVKRPAWDDRRLDRVLGGFDYLVQSHFRYYEFCGNTLLALLWSYALNRGLGTLPYLSLATDLAMAAVLLVLFLASRNALANCYRRTRRLIGRPGTTSETNPCTTGTTTAAAKSQPQSLMPSHRATPR